MAPSVSPTPPNSPKRPGDVGAAPPASVPTESAPRRGFLTRFLAVIIGGIVALAPLSIGVAFFMDPLRKRKKRVKPGEAVEEGPEGFVKVATLDALLVGVPQSFTVIDDRSDAWNLFPREPVGGVYLLRRKDGTVLALNDTCPHAGCGVDYKPGDKQYQCPCHNSSFNQDGSLCNPKSPSPRGLDELETYIDPKNGRIWVKFQVFQSGTARKIPEE